VRRAAALVAAAGAVSAVIPAAASAEISCALQEVGAPGPPDNVLAIGAGTPELDVVAVARAGDEIAVSNDAMGVQVPCAGGTPTVNGIDTINFTGAQATSLVIDLRGGQFEPGATAAALGPEIEWNLDLTDGFLVVNSVTGPDAIGLGATDSGPRVNLNRAFEDPWDAEVALGGVQSVFLRGDGGAELLTASGSLAPFNEFSGPLEHTVGLDGGGGNDLLLGGAAADLLDGGPGGDTLDGGPGRDDLAAGGGGDKIRARDGARDRIACGSGKDKVKADAKDKLVGC
jgi:Ca2+-binding RTX toxin-like protein